MKCLTVPVPETLTASYLVPLPGPATAGEIQQRIVDAAAAGLPGEFAACFRNWLGRGLVSATVLTPAEAAGVLPDLEDATTRERALIRTAGAFARVTVTRGPSIIALHEWQARGCAAFVAAEPAAPVIDERAGAVLSAQEAFASMPALGEAGAFDGLTFTPHLWVRFHGFEYRGRYWAQSEGMRHFGMPEVFVGGTERDLREELRDIALCVAFRLWSDFARRAEAAAGTSDMFATPRTLVIPAELELHRRHLDGARGLPDLPGAPDRPAAPDLPGAPPDRATPSVTVRLSLENGDNGQPVLAVVPPADWDMSWESFIGDVCHSLFGFEKPPWHYLPELGALMQAERSLPDARRRFVDGELPSCGSLLVRYGDPADPAAPLRWGRVESWDDEDTAAVRDIGPELAPAVRAADPQPVETKQIIDWAIWIDGQGVVEGGHTEAVVPA